MHYRMPILKHALPILIYWLGFRLHILIHALPILTHLLGFRLSAPYLNTCITYPNTLGRLSAPYLNTCITYLNILSRFSGRPTRQPIRIEHYVTRELSAADQNRVLRHPSRHYVTREPSAPGRPFSVLGSIRLAIAYLKTWGSTTPPPPPNQLTLSPVYRNQNLLESPCSPRQWSVQRYQKKQSVWKSDRNLI